MALRKKEDQERLRIVGRVLQEARQKRGLTQQEVARRLRKTQSYVVKMENGQRRVCIVDMVGFLRVYKLSPNEFIRMFPKKWQVP